MMDNEEKDLKNNHKAGETYHSPPLEVVCDNPSPPVSEVLKWALKSLGKKLFEIKTDFHISI